MNTRGKGSKFERDVAAELERAGLEVRGLESGGDHFAVVAGGVVYHVEAKRQERLQVHVWLRQQDRDCPPGMRRVLVFKRSREPAYAVEPFAQFVASVNRDVRLAALREDLRRRAHRATATGAGDERVAGYEAGLLEAAEALDALGAV